MPGGAIHVSGLSLTAIKGTRLRTVPGIELGPEGARGDRAFFVVDDRGRVRNGKQIGELQAVSADYDVAAKRLSLEFPDGRTVAGEVELGEAVETRFYSEPLPARPVLGPFSAALSEFLGQPLRLVAPARAAIDRGPQGAASIISRGSLQELARVAEQDGVDARRFRMLIEVDGVAAHGEDDWMDRPVRIGQARVVVRGNIGRCLVTSRDPDSGQIDLPTLDLLGCYRKDLHSTEPLPFGVHAEVVEPGTVRVGDAVAVEA